jgi:hypothetical protein
MLEASLERCVRLLEDQAFIFSLQTIKQLIEAAFEVLSERYVLVNADLITLGGEAVFQMCPTITKHRLTLGEWDTNELHAVMHDLVKDVQLILDVRRFAVNQLGDKNIPTWAKVAEEVNVLLLRRPQLVVIAAGLMLSMTGLEDDLVAFGEDDSARPIFFLFAPASAVVQNGSTLPEGT